MAGHRLIKFFCIGCLLIMSTISLHAQNNSDEQLAQMFFQDRDYEKAAALYEKLYDAKPNYNYYTYLMFCYIETNDFKKAEKIVRKQIKIEPNAQRYKVDLGFIYSRQGEISKAQRQYDDIINDLPPDRNQISEVANAFLSRRENDLALKTYQKGRQLLNNTYPFYYEIAMIYQVAGDYGSMIDEYLNYIDFDITRLAFVQDRLQDALSNDPDGNKSETFRKALLRRIQKNPEKSYYSELLIWFSVQQKDFELAFTQAKSLDRRLGEDGHRIYDLARFCVNNGNYDVGEQAYRYVIDRGKDSPFYMTARIELLKVMFLKLTSNYSITPLALNQLEKDYEGTLTELGKTNSTLTLVQNLAHLEAFYLNNTEKATTLLTEALEIPNATQQQKAELKLELADVYLFTGEVWEATLLYSQVDKTFKNDPLGHEAKFRNARLSYFIGEFGWAKAQLDVLKAATSKLICNNAMELSMLISDNLNQDTTGTALKKYARAEMYAFRNLDELALQTFDSVARETVPHTLFDDVLIEKAKIYMKKGNFTEADTLFAEAYINYPEEVKADRALFQRAELNENQLNNKNKAMGLYELLLTKYPGSLYAVDARKRFRSLRGDNIN